VLGSVFILCHLCSFNDFSRVDFLLVGFRFFLKGELLSQFRVRLQHDLQFSIGATVQSNFGQRIHRLRFLILFSRSFNHVLFEDSDSAQLSQNLVDTGRAVSGFLFQHAENEAIHFLSDVGIEFGGIGRLVSQVPHQQFFGRGGLKWRAPG